MEGLSDEGNEPKGAKTLVKICERTKISLPAACTVEE